MTLKNFLETYRINIKEHNLDNISYVIITEVAERSSNKIVDSIRTILDIQEKTEWIKNTQTQMSLTPWDWTKLIDQTKRAQLDYFSQRVPIEDFFPLNSATDISKLS